MAVDVAVPDITVCVTAGGVDADAVKRGVILLGGGLRGLIDISEYFMAQPEGSLTSTSIAKGFSILAKIYAHFKLANRVHRYTLIN